MMTIDELGKALHEMYFNSEKGESVAMIHLFGIKYANEIKSSGYTVKEIVSQAKLNSSYGTEVSKGMKLSRYVTVKA